MTAACRNHPLALSGGQLTLDAAGSLVVREWRYRSQIGGRMDTPTLASCWSTWVLRRLVDAKGQAANSCSAGRNSPAQLHRQTLAGKLDIEVGSSRLLELSPGVTRVVGLPQSQRADPPPGDSISATSQERLQLRQHHRRLRVQAGHRGDRQPEHDRPDRAHRHPRPHRRTSWPRRRPESRRDRAWTRHCRLPAPSPADRSPVSPCWWHRKSRPSRSMN